MGDDKIREKDLKHWQETLTSDQFRVCWLKQTEAPFSGKYDNFWQEGVFNCVCCKQPLFHSQAKLKSHSGWPSFLQPASQEALSYATDDSHNMLRMEVLCKGCGAHLGHVFDDGPEPTGKRYCINSVALEFVPKA